MKSLIICGPQSSGKTLLGDWIRNLTNIVVIDEQSKTTILSIIKSQTFEEIVMVYITNDIITYNDVDPSRYHIVNLQKDF